MAMNAAFKGERGRSWRHLPHVPNVQESLDKKSPAVALVSSPSSLWSDANEPCVFQCQETRGGGSGEEKRSFVKGEKVQKKKVTRGN